MSACAYARERARTATGSATRRRILVALGARRAPLEAIELGRRIADALGAPLHGIFVWPSPISPSDVPRLLELEPEALAGMELDVEVGDAAERIAASAEAQAVAYLVLSAERERACPLGAVTERALERAGTGVFVVRPGVTIGRLERILLPLDGAPSTAAAIAPVAELAQLVGAQVDVILVGESGSAERAAEPGAMAPPRYVDQPQHEWAAFSEEFIERFLLAIGHCPPGVCARFLLRVGDPGEEILRAAEELGSDLIALVWRGGVSDRDGAVIRRVLREASRPVLVLRGCPR